MRMFSSACQTNHVKKMATCAVPSTIMFYDNLLLATCTSNLDTLLLIISDILVGHLFVNYSLIRAASLSSVVTFSPEDCNGFLPGKERRTKTQRGYSSRFLIRKLNIIQNNKHGKKPNQS